MTQDAAAAPDPSALLSELIGLIYEAATDLSLWPRLLEGMAEYLTITGTASGTMDADLHRIVAGWFQGPGLPMPVPATESERSLLACLAPHFVRAHEIHRQLAATEEERNLLEGVMDRLPLGMAIVDGAGAVISLNRAMLTLVQGDHPLKVESGRLVSRPATALAEALRAALEDNAADQPLRLLGDEGAAPFSLWVSRLAAAAGSAWNTGRVIVLAAGQTNRALSESGLCALFNLTPAEARLTQQMTLGRTIEEAAAVQGIAIGTARTQLKRVFTKVGVRRQAELLQAVYASPLWLDVNAAPAGARPLVPGIAALGAQNEEQAEGFRLADGRWLAYSDSGDPNGLPVVFMHGIAGSRHLRHPDDDILLAHGMRLIIPERPGSGDSDPLPGRVVADWPRDVAALADHLRLARFVVMGYSAGTPYALATALALPNRIISVFIVAAMSPVERLEDMRDYSATFRMSLLVAKYAPSLLPPLLRVMVKGIRGNVYRYIEQTLEDATDSDRQVFQHARLRASYARGLLAGVKRGEQDFALEVLLAAGAWGIKPEDIAAPVHFWHGEADRLVAPASARRLAARIPGAHLVTTPGAGHYVLYSHWPEILADIRALEAAGNA